MANRKISDLTALTAPATGDLLPIVDISEAAAADKNKKITFGELFASIPAGTAAAPSVAFEGYPGTGVYSSGADEVAISTNGTGRLFVDASGKVGLGTSSPGTILHTVNTSAGAATVGAFIQNSSLTAGTEVRLGFAPNTNVVGDNRYSWIGAVNSAGSNDSSLTFATTPGGTGATERMRLDSSGPLLLGTSSDSGGALLQVNGDRIRIGTAKTPASATATGTTGEIAWDANYIYVCTATNTWKRTAISTW